MVNRCEVLGRFMWRVAALGGWWQKEVAQRETGNRKVCFGHMNPIQLSGFPMLLPLSFASTGQPIL